MLAPFDRHGRIVAGGEADIRSAVTDALRQASRPSILGADCTLPSDIDWAHVHTAVAAAHASPD
jgi:hypothetical protein